MIEFLFMSATIFVAIIFAIRCETFHSSFDPFDLGLMVYFVHWPFLTPRRWLRIIRSCDAYVPHHNQLFDLGQHPNLSNFFCHRI